MKKLLGPALLVVITMHFCGVVILTKSAALLGGPAAEGVAIGGALVASALGALIVLAAVWTRR